MACPICEKRKAKRFCPAKGEHICSVCCGTEREVTIDCPSDCPYLVASRQHDSERRQIDWAKIPFSDVRIPPSTLADHEDLLAALAYAICVCARERPALVDSDVRAVLEGLASAYRALASGIYYERLPDYYLQRELYDSLKAGIEDYRKARAREAVVSGLRHETIRDALIFFAQLSATRSNGRPKGRAYIDFLRSQFKPEEVSRPASSIVLLP